MSSKKALKKACYMQALYQMAPAVGLEPTTDRLTADCSTTELRWNTPFCWRPVPESNRHKRICSPLHKPFCQPAIQRIYLFYLISKNKSRKKIKFLNFFFNCSILAYIISKEKRKCLRKSQC